MPPTLCEPRNTPASTAELELRMRRIVVGFFALIGLFFFAIIVIAIAVLIWAAPGEKNLAEANILTLDLTQSLPEAPPDGGVERVILGGQLNCRYSLHATA